MAKNRKKVKSKGGKKKTVSEKQLQANRQNAQKSTGPTSAAGKARSRFNAFKHGLTGMYTLMPWESNDEFKEYLDMFVLELEPQGAIEYKLALRVAEYNWRIDRAAVFEAPVADDALSRQEMLLELTRLSTYETRLVRNYERTMKELRRLRAERRAGERTPLPDAVLFNPDPEAKGPGPGFRDDLPGDREAGRRHREHLLDVARATIQYRCQSCEAHISAREIADRQQTAATRQETEAAHVQANRNPKTLAQKEAEFKEQLRQHHAQLLEEARREIAAKKAQNGDHKAHSANGQEAQMGSFCHDPVAPAAHPANPGGSPPHNGGHQGA
jgi:hypothetical protein